MLEDSLKYSLLVFAAVVGILQVAGNQSGNPWYTFFKSKIIAVVFAVVTAGGSLFAFFIWNYWSDTGIIQGSQQFGLFTLSTVAALIFTFLVSGLINGKILNAVSSWINSIPPVKLPEFSKRSRKRKEKCSV
jgi:hypothetical protein